MRGGLGKARARPREAWAQMPRAGRGLARGIARGPARGSAGGAGLNFRCWTGSV
jgi:hypothetical protein